eukprot:IDg6260t1
MTEVIHPTDLGPSEFGQAKSKEIEGLIKGSTFKIFLKAEFLKTSMSSGEYLFYQLKMKEVKEKYGKPDSSSKAIAIKRKTSLVHDLSTARHHSIRMLI